MGLADYTAEVESVTKASISRQARIFAGVAPSEHREMPYRASSSRT